MDLEDLQFPQPSVSDELSLHPVLSHPSNITQGLSRIALTLPLICMILLLPPHAYPGATTLRSKDIDGKAPNWKNGQHGGNYYRYADDASHIFIGSLAIIFSLITLFDLQQ